MLEKTVAQTTIAKEVSLTGVGLHLSLIHI